MKNAVERDATELPQITAFVSSPRFDGILRLHSPRQIAEQRGTIQQDHPVAREAAVAFYDLLRERFARGETITTFGPYSSGQAVAMRRMGVEAIYLGGWATSAKGGPTEDPGPDLASYPLSQVPDEAATIVRALLTADRNQRYDRARLTAAQREAAPEIDYRPFVIADADTGHGGDAHVRNLIRRFVEAGIPGYHIEDQKPGVKKCGHQGGKVVVSEFEQLSRLNAARFQLDVMGVPGIIVARTDAESAQLLEGGSDERDQPFILGVANRDVPTYRAVAITMMSTLFNMGVSELRGHLLYALPAAEREEARAWLTRAGIMPALAERAAAYVAGTQTDVDALFDELTALFLDAWARDAGLTTYAQAVAATIEDARAREDWLAAAARLPWREARTAAASIGAQVAWDPEAAKTPDGYYQVDGGIDYAIAKSLAAAPFADLLWMETATANLADARRFADAIHAVFPGKMLAYNLSPSFNWDTTGMTDEEMRAFPAELGRLGYVFTFITYGGHQVDGLAAEEFARAVRDDGMLALARLQRRIRLVGSAYRTPQTLVGGPRLDAALGASTGRTATTKAMGHGSTQHQHLKQTEVVPAVLDRWLEAAGLSGAHASLRPHVAGTDTLRLEIRNGTPHPLATVVFGELQDREGRRVLAIREHVTETSALGGRLATLAHLFLLRRHRPERLHVLTPTDEDRRRMRALAELGLVAAVTDGEHVLVAVVDGERAAVLDPATLELREGAAA